MQDSERDATILAIVVWTEPYKQALAARGYTAVEHFFSGGALVIQARHPDGGKARFAPIVDGGGRITRAIAAYNGLIERGLGKLVGYREVRDVTLEEMQQAVLDAGIAPPEAARLAEEMWPEG